jgi:MFS transporter, DHA1 family, tetracycline resistance protein
MTRRSPLAVVFFTVFLDLVGFGIVLPLAAYYVRALGGAGASDRWVGTMTTWLGTSYSLMQFFFAPFWGRLSDRVGRRPIILMSVSGSCLSYLLFSFAVSDPSARLLGLTGSLVLLITSRALAGMMAANISTAMAYVADVTTPENRTRGMGMIGAAFGLGFVFGPAIGAGLSGGGQHPTLAVPLLAAGLSLLDLVLAWLLLPESLRLGTGQAVGRRAFGLPGLGRALSHPRVGVPILMFFCSTLAFAGLEWTLAAFLMSRYHLGPRQAGELFAYAGVLIALVQGGLVGRMAKGSREPHLLVLGTLLMAIGLALVPATHSLGTLLGVLAVVAFGQGITSPSTSSLISKSIDASEQGAILGVNQGMSSLARAIGPALAGILIASRGLSAPFLASGTIMALAFLLSLRVMAARRK